MHRPVGPHWPAHWVSPLQRSPACFLTVHVREVEWQYAPSSQSFPEHVAPTGSLSMHRTSPSELRSLQNLPKGQLSGLIVHGLPKPGASTHLCVVESQV